MSPPVRNVVVVGGSYVGLNTARELMKVVPASHRVLLIEPRSHFNHIFTFPRFAVMPGHEQKAFVPYSGVFGSTRHALVTARATEVFDNYLHIDRNWEGSEKVPFEYLVIATGTLLAPPSMMPFNEKPPSLRYIQDHQAQIQAAKNLTIVGGGAVGVQMAFDVKELYPEKEVTLVHSRDRLMQLYHQEMHRILKTGLEELGVRVITGARAVAPAGGFQQKASPELFELELNNGQRLQTNLVVPATGQKPNNQLLKTLSTSNPEGLINKANGFIRVKKTLQVDDAAHPNIFALGDIADSGAHKAARPGAAQAGVVTKNILSLLEGKAASEEYTPGPAGIHLSMGLKRNMIFRNPDVAAGETEPTVMEKFDGVDDLSAVNMWTRLNVSYNEEPAVAAI